MKKALIMVIQICLILVSGCTKFSNTSISTTNDLTPAMQDELNISKTDTYSNQQSSFNKEIACTPFFFKANISLLSYQGSFLFDDDIEKDVNLHINELCELKYGKLFELKIDPIEGVPNERLNLGYFYVQKDKVYRINPSEENRNNLKTFEELPNDYSIVCQDKEMKDTLKSDERGWHQYIIINGDECEYHSFNNQVETGYYESFIWKKDKGLIFYQSGFGAERDSMKIQISEEITETLQSEISSWVGNYTFSEFVPPDENMFYNISLYKENDEYYANINIDGFQTMQRLKAKVEGDQNSIKFIFNQYLPENIFELYKKGDILLSFEKKKPDIVTFWGKIEPIDNSNKGSGNVYFRFAP